MSKRVSNSRRKIDKRTGRVSGKLHARQTVRLGWRKRKAKAVIAYMRDQLRLAKMAEGQAEA